MSTNIYVIYKHTSPSGKSYIGQTKHLEQRTKEHLSKHSRCLAFKGAIKKYGWKNFSTEILASNLSIKEANILETFFILEHNTLAPHGYNLTTGGDGKILSQSTKEKLSEQRRGKPLSDKHKQSLRNSWATRDKASIVAKIKNTKQSRTYTTRVGAPLTEEHKQKIREARTGTRLSEETKQKISDANKGKTQSPESIELRLATLLEKHNGQYCSDETREHIRQIRTGTTRSDETKQKMSQQRKGRKLQIDPITGKRSYYFP